MDTDEADAIPPLWEDLVPDAAEPLELPLLCDPSVFQLMWLNSGPMLKDDKTGMFLNDECPAEMKVSSPQTTKYDLSPCHI